MSELPSRPAAGLLSEARFSIDAHKVTVPIGKAGTCYITVGVFVPAANRQEPVHPVFELGTGFNPEIIQRRILIIVECKSNRRREHQLAQHFIVNNQFGGVLDTADLD